MFKSVKFAHPLIKGAEVFPPSNASGSPVPFLINAVTHLQSNFKVMVCFKKCQLLIIKTLTKENWKKCLGFKQTLYDTLGRSLNLNQWQYLGLVICCDNKQAFLRTTDPADRVQDH